jgi:hypothetical protein
MEREVYAILRPWCRNWDLKGLYEGVFNPERTKFVAHTYVVFDQDNRNDFSFLTREGHMSVGVEQEKTKKWVGEHVYQLKEVVECVAEGIYRAYTYRFTGIWYEENWWVLPELIFFGELMDEAGAKVFLTRGMQEVDFWDKGLFADRVQSRFPGSEREMRNIEWEPFEGMPFMVGWLKIRQKTAVKKAFVEYMQVTVVEPFLRQMRIRFPVEYMEFLPLYEQYCLLFPADRDCFLLVTLARHQTLGWRLVWFFYDLASARFYRWTFPKPRYSGRSHHYSEDVIEDIAGISDWDDPGFLQYWRTMDDRRFWDEYVLKEEDGRYLWLKG